MAGVKGNGKGPGQNKENLKVSDSSSLGGC